MTRRQARLTSARNLRRTLANAMPQTQDEIATRFKAGSSLALAALANRNYETQTIEQTASRQIILAKRGATFVILLRKMDAKSPQCEKNFLFNLAMQDFTLDDLREALADESGPQPLADEVRQTS